MAHDKLFRHIQRLSGFMPAFFELSTMRLHRLRAFATRCFTPFLLASLAGSAASIDAAEDAGPGFRILGEEGSQPQPANDLQLAETAKRGTRPVKPASAKSPYGQDPSAYTLTFAEEFDSFNRKLWNDHIWYEKSNPTKNFTVEDGVLKIWPQRDASGEFFNRTLDTDGKFYQTYGYFEMEAKLPRGRGVWPAFWLLAHPGEKSRPEIDIMEAYPAGEGWGYTDKQGMQRPNVFGTTVWIGDGRSAGLQMNEAHTDLSTSFHKYAVKWEPNKHTFYFDGKPVHVVEGVHMTDPMYILLDVWFGSAGGTPDDTTPQGKGNSFEVNYVRAWQFRHLKKD
jgi:beta-glucanase (GH16 family)